jgi:hypothetical protein
VHDHTFSTSGYTNVFFDAATVVQRIAGSGTHGLCLLHNAISCALLVHALLLFDACAAEGFAVTAALLRNVLFIQLHRPHLVSL